MVGVGAAVGCGVLVAVDVEVAVGTTVDVDVAVGVKVIVRDIAVAGTAVPPSPRDARVQETRMMTAHSNVTPNNRVTMFLILRSPSSPFGLFQSDAGTRQIALRAHDVLLRIDSLLMVVDQPSNALEFLI